MLICLYDVVSSFVVSNGFMSSDVTPPPFPSPPLSASTRRLYWLFKVALHYNPGSRVMAVVMYKCRLQKYGGLGHRLYLKTSHLQRGKVRSEAVREDNFI